MARTKKPITVRPKLRKRKRTPAAFIRTQMKSAADDVLGIGFWKHIKVAAAVPPMPHPFLAELAAFPITLGVLGSGLGSLVDEDDAVKRFALTAGLAGLGIALGRGAAAKLLPRASQNIKGLLSGTGMGSGMMASDLVLPAMGHEPVFGNIS